MTFGRTMRQPTKTQMFFARDWPKRIWFVLVPLPCVVLAVSAVGPTAASFSVFWGAWVWLAAVICGSVSFGLCAATVLGWLILGPIYHVREIGNGGPFKPGDVVRVLTGPNRGRITRVRSGWQGNLLRVDLGQQAEEEFRDIFAPTALLREEDAEPADGE